MPAGEVVGDDAPTRIPDALTGAHADALTAAVTRIGHELVTPRPSFDTLLHLVAEKACALIDVSRCGVYLYAEETGLYHGRAGYADTGMAALDAQVRRLTAGGAADAFTQEILESGAPVLIRNAQDDPRPVRAAMRRWGPLSILGVPLAFGDRIIGLLFLDNEDQQHPFDDSQLALAAAFGRHAAAAVAQAEQSVRLTRAVSVLRRQSEIAREAAGFQERITRLAIEGGDVAQLVAATALATGKPCAVHGDGGQRLAAAPAPTGDTTVLPTLLGERTRSCPAVADVLAGLQDAQAEVVGPLAAAGIQHRHLVAPITVRDERLGLLVVMEWSARLGELDLLVARHAATALGLRLAESGRPGEWEAGESLVSELLCGNRDTLALAHRAAALGVDLAAPHVVVFVTRPAADSAPHACARDLARALQVGRDSRVLATSVADGAVVVLPVGPGPPDRRVIARARAQVAACCAALDAGEPGEAPRAIVALSTVCREPGEIARGAREARDLAAVIGTLNDGRRSVALAVDELGAGRLVLLGGDPFALQSYADDALGALLDDHGKKHADLLVTLHAFLDCSRSVRRCAERLDVHENTVRYRLTRVQELTGLDVAAEGDHQLTAQIALLALRMRGALDELRLFDPADR